jgi:DNA repair protein RAD5
MLKREGKSSIKEEETLHPMWLEYELPERGHLYFNEFTGQVSAEPPIFKSKCKGGILADEMGLGKTVMLIALMATNRTANNKSAKNLIVLPLTLLEQWESEILLHTKPRSLRVLRYYETSDRNRSILDYDVVLTTYGVISQEFAQGNHITNTGLFKY